MFFFLSFCTCLYWKYNPDEYEELEKNSVKRPIFALATLSTCPHCKGIPTRLRQFSDSLGDSTKVIFTTLVCDNNTLCKKMNVRGVPMCFLIRGSDPKLWLTTMEQTIDGWASFLAEALESKLTEIKSQEEMEKSLINTFEGGSAFLLKYNPLQDMKYYKEFRQFSKIYNLIGCRFFVQSNSNETSISAYRSEYCSVTQNLTKVSEIKEFIDNYRFSVFHSFDSGDIKEQLKLKRNLLLEIVESPFSSHAYIGLIHVSEKYCNKYEVGWIDPNGDPLALQWLNLPNNSDNHYVAAINQKTGCYILHNATGNYEEYTSQTIVKETETKSSKCQKIPHISKTNRFFNRKVIILYCFGILLCIAFVSYFVFQICQDGMLKAE